MKEQAIKWLQNPTKMTLFGVTIQQTWPDLWLWEKLLNEHPEIRTIVEIGTKHGGLSNYLLCQAIQRAQRLMTFDIEAYQPNRLARRLGLIDDFLLGDVFENDGAVLKGLLANDTAHPLVLLCDGGQKEREFQMFVPCLRPGDIVGAHDWNTEFWPHSVEPVAHMVEPIMWAECEALDSWTRFWRRV